MRKVTVLAGGVGGARFCLGVRAAFGSAATGGPQPITVIGNVGDDLTRYGLRICPDLDTLMYTLGGGIDIEQGWGRASETFGVRDELSAYGEDDWFTLGDRDLATHLLRTGWLAGGATLSEVTQRLAQRWAPGVRLLPATDQPAETHVRLADGRRVHFQEWWVRWHAAVPASGFDFAGAAGATPAPGVIEALNDADLVLLGPSNPVVSIGAILAIPGIARAVRNTRAPVIGLSPIIAGAPVRGMADACLQAEGVASDAAAVARRYGSRRHGGLIDGWLVDEVDAPAAAVLSQEGFATSAVPLLMHDVEASGRMALAAAELAGSLGR